METGLLRKQRIMTSQNREKVGCKEEISFLNSHNLSNCTGNTDKANQSKLLLIKIFGFFKSVPQWEKRTFSKLHGVCDISQF